LTELLNWFQHTISSGSGNDGKDVDEKAGQAVGPLKSSNPK
jgi:hypothetical protein